MVTAMFSKTNVILFITGIETGGVVLKDPHSVSEIQTSAPISLQCHINGHPRYAAHCFTELLQHL